MKYFQFSLIMVISTFMISSALAQSSNKAKIQGDYNIFDEITSPYIEKQIEGRFHSASINWQIPQNLSLTEPVHFPYQDPDKFYQESFPTFLANGQILFAWASNDTIYYAQSSDSGLTWGPPNLITYGGYNPYDLSGICTSTGRVIAVWQAGQGLEMSYSDDNGVNWSVRNLITYDGGDRFPTINQTLDDKLWFVYARSNPGTDYDIYYRTSTDDGMTWSYEQTLVASPFNDLFGQIVSGSGTTLLAIYRDNANGHYDINQKSSSDGGLTWSAPSPILNSPLEESMPRVLRQSNGSLWLIYYLFEPTPILPEYSQWDIYYIQSFDGGSTWTTPTEFTRYVEYDGWHNATLVDNQPFVSFASTRWSPNIGQRHLWYGIIGITQDTNPPPAVFGVLIGIPASNVPVYLQARVDDETGISDVQLLYSVNSIPLGPVQMFDDGLHNDENPGDNIWGASIGPFQFGDIIEYSASVTDVTSNMIIVYGNSYELGLVHDVGNVILNFRKNSQLADQGNSFSSNAYWPRVSGENYLFCGGLWIGAEVWGEYRVMNFHYDGNVDWQQTPGSIVTLGPGTSDQDGNVSYDDQYALSSPIGLQVHQESFQWSNLTRDDFIIFEYIVKNTGLNGNLNNVFAAVWTDPDLINPGDDLGGYDNQRGLLYMYDNQGNPDGYIGLKLLNSGPMPYTARMDQGSTVPGDDFGRYQFMTSGFPSIPTNPNDYNILLTSQPFSLTVGDSHSVAFGLVMGGSLTELQANADTMQFIYNNVVLVPTITVSDDTLDFGQVFLGVTDSLELIVENTGTRELHILEAHNFTSEYQVFPFIGSINPGESEIFTVTFSPQAIGNYPDILEIICNDPTQDTCMVILRGQGVEAPVISVLPDSLSENLETGQTSAQTLTITNTGGGDLVFFISAGSGSNYALQFDGVDDYVEIPDNVSLDIINEFSFEAWINPISYTYGGRVAGKFYSSSWSFNWDANYHYLAWEANIGGSSQYNSFTSNLNLNQCYHIAVTFNSSLPSDHVRLYINGLLDGQYTRSGQLGTDDNPLRIGRGWVPEFFNGEFDEVRIWNVARTQSEIQANMYREIQGTEPGLVAYWQFNEGSGSTVFDHTSNDNDGTLYGGVSWVMSSTPFWPAWLSVTPDSGICAPDSSVDIVVSFNATNLDTGDYDATIVIACNDPLIAECIIPVHLHVSPATGIEGQITEHIPKRYMLYQNYPNPFNPGTTIEFDLPKTSEVSLKIFNILGEEVTTLVSDRLSTGSYSYDWDVGKLASGVYLYRLKAGDYVETRKMVLMR
jgi:hypothetical protein